MRNITEANSTGAVLVRSDTDDPRLHEIISQLVKHTRAFIRDVEPTEAEMKPSSPISSPQGMNASTQMRSSGSIRGQNSDRQE